MRSRLSVSSWSLKERMKESSLTAVDTIAGNSAKYYQHDADCAKSGRRRGGDSAWRDRAEREATFGKERIVPNA